MQLFSLIVQHFHAEKWKGEEGAQFGRKLPEVGFYVAAEFFQLGRDFVFNSRTRTIVACSGWF